MNQTTRPGLGAAPASLKLASRKKLKAVLQVVEGSYHNGTAATVSGQHSIEAGVALGAEYPRTAKETGPASVANQGVPPAYEGPQQHSTISVKQSVKQLSEYTRNNRVKKEASAVSKNKEKLDISHASQFSQESPLKVERKLQLKPIEKTAIYNPKKAGFENAREHDTKTYEIALDAAI